MGRPKEKLPEFYGGRSGQRTLSNVDPKTLELRTRIEQITLAEIEKRVPALFEWIDRHLKHGTEMGDKPMVDLIKAMLDKAVPERRQVEAPATQGGGRGGAMMVVVNNGKIQRGTKKSRDRAIEMRKRGGGGFEPEGGDGDGAGG